TTNAALSSEHQNQTLGRPARKTGERSLTARSPLPFQYHLALGTKVDFSIILRLENVPLPPILPARARPPQFARCPAVSAASGSLCPAHRGTSSGRTGTPCRSPPRPCPPVPPRARCSPACLSPHPETSAVSPDA